MKILALATIMLSLSSSNSNLEISQKCQKAFENKNERVFCGENVFPCMYTPFSVQALSEIPLFFIEGAPGVGKTTFIELLKNNVPGIKIVYEPVEKFINVKNQGNILNLFFSDFQRWSLTTEIYMTLMHLQAIENVEIDDATQAIFVDRSIYADYYIFVKMAYDTGMINNMEWAIYQEFFDYIEKSSKKPQGFIYLQAPAQVVLNRMQLRDRIEENNVSLQWQLDQERYHHAWFIEKNNISVSIAHIPTLIIDATENFRDDPIVQKKCIEQVNNFISAIEKPI